MCISAGASVSGASWNTISSPSIRWVSIGWLITRVGGISVTVPRETTLPSPASTWPRGPLGSVGPNWNCARRTIGVPASTFSETTSSMNPSGRDDLHAPGPDIGLVDHPAHAAVVIGVAVGVDDRGDRPPAAVLEIEVEARARRLGRDQRIDDDQAALAFDDGHVGDVEAADLIDPVGDLEEPVVHVETGLTPEAGIHRRRAPRRARGRRNRAGSTRPGPARS